MDEGQIVEQLFSIDGLKEEFIEKKAWGLKYNLCFNTGSRFDILHMEKGGYTSIHYHEHKKNRLFCIYGKLDIKIYSNKEEDGVIWKYTNTISSNSKYKIYDIQPGIMHQLHAIEKSLILEIDMLKVDRNDIIRSSDGGIK